MTKIYYDSEFTGLHQHTTLISIGLVSETGETFYAESNDYDKSQVDEWIQDNVIAKLAFSNHSEVIEPSNNQIVKIKSDTKTIQTYLTGWLAQFDQVQIISDVAHYDFVLFLQLWGHAFNIPKNVAPVCHDINQDIAKFLGITDAEAFDINREEFSGLVASDNDKHNALWDAQVIKACAEKLGVL